MQAGIWSCARRTRCLGGVPTSAGYRSQLRSSTLPLRSDRSIVTCSINKTSARSHIARIEISNPSKLNVVNTETLSQLTQTCRTLSTNEHLRAVILSGAPTAHGKRPSFIGGADITEMANLSSGEDARTFISNVHAACAALRDLPMVVIARIHGFCLGAGLEVALSCDLRIATKDSVFGMPEVKVGIPSVVEAALLPSIIGMGRTRRLLYLAENITGTEAEQWGLIEAVVADEIELDSLVADWTGKLVDMSPKALRSQKTLMRKWEDCSISRGIQAGIEAYASAYADGGQEPKEFMGKFLKRKR